MIVASEIELRAGARLLLESASFQVSAGDRIGLVGRNGAGKTTLAKVLAGEAQPAAGSVRRSGTVGYLPQDPRTGNLDMLAIDRVLSARGLDQLRAELRAAEAAMAASDSGTAAAAIRTYGRLEERLAVLGGYAAESQAASITASLGLPDRVLQQPRETDERRRRRERVNAGRQASALMAQADKMRAKATKARAAQNMQRRAERMLAGVEAERTADRVARLRFPVPAPCGRTPLTAEGLSKSYGSDEVFTGVDVAVDRGSRVVILGLNGAGKTTLLRLLAGLEVPDTGKLTPGHGLSLGYYAQEHETLETDRTVLSHMRTAAPDLTESEQRKVLGSFLFSGDDVEKPAGVLSGGEKTRLALALLVVSGANVLLLDEPTNNLDPASREEVLEALRSYRGAIVLVTHDEGAVQALSPERVIVLPDGVEDAWSEDFADLVALA